MPRAKRWLSIALSHSPPLWTSSTSQRTPSLIIPSEPHSPRTVGAGNYDFSILVQLQRSHQTRHAAKGVPTRSVVTNRPNESVLCKLIQGVGAVLRQEQIRALGTGQDRKLHWQTAAQGENSDPECEYQQPAPVPTGNSANAVTIAALRARKVLFSVFCILTLSELTSI